MARTSNHQITAYSPHLDTYEAEEDDEIEIIEVLCGSGYKWVRPENQILPDNMVPARLDGKVVAISSNKEIFELDVSKWMLNLGNLGEDEDVLVLVGTSVESGELYFIFTMILSQIARKV